MKILKTIIFVLVILVAEKTSAQVIYTYDTCDLSIYRQFEGEWRYVNGTDTIKIYLKAIRNIYPFGDFNTLVVRDQLIGWHEYKKGNVLIKSNFNNRFMTIPSNIYILPVGTISIALHINKNFSSCSTNARKLFGIMDDTRLNHEQINVERAIFDTNLQTLQWTQWRTDFSRNPESAIMTLPCCFTLTKQ